MKYPISLPYFPESEISPILKEFETILRGDAVLSMGRKVLEFQKQFSHYVGTQYAVATNSCSAALEIALRSIGISNGDEVIVPAETFIATGSSVVREGGTPVFANIDPDTFCLSLETVSQKMSQKTKAVIIVHMAGLITPEIYKIRDLCKEKGIFLIEDAAHAPGATLDNKKAGSFGDVGCFSFYPTKVMTTAEGGMLVTNNADIFVKADGYRQRGLDLSAKTETYAALGTNNRMNEFQAILGLSQLKCLDDFVGKRNVVASTYNKVLSSLTDKGYVKPLACPANVTHSYWRYVVRLHEKIDRKSLQRKMRERGVAVDWAYDPPLHLQPVFIKMFGTRAGMLQESEKAMRHFACLPIYAQMKESDAIEVASILSEVLESCFV